MKTAENLNIKEDIIYYIKNFETEIFFTNVENPLRSKKKYKNRIKSACNIQKQLYKF